MISLSVLLSKNSCPRTQVRIIENARSTGLNSGLQGEQYIYLPPKHASIATLTQAAFWLEALSRISHESSLNGGANLYKMKFATRSPVTGPSKISHARNPSTPTGRAQSKPYL